MRMTRYFFISTDLNDLEHFEQDLERAGIVTPQIHVLTDHEGEAHSHHVHQVSPFMKKDVVHSALLGAAVGVCLAVLVLLITVVAGWHETEIGGWPFIFLAVILMGFCTWIGGFWGIQTSNSRTRRFDQALKEGKHVFFVDHPQGQGTVLEDVSQRYPSVAMAGLARGAPSWIVFSQHNIKRFFTETFP